MTARAARYYRWIHPLREQEKLVAVDSGTAIVNSGSGTLNVTAQTTSAQLPDATVGVVSIVPAASSRKHEYGRGRRSSI
jgi:hypothetical protein